MPAALFHRLADRLKSDLGRALIRTFLARGIASMGSLAMAIVVGRLYGPGGLGVFALAQSFLLGAGIFSRMGMDRTLVRYVGQDCYSPHIKGYLTWCCSRASLLGFLFAMALFLLAPIFESLFDYSGLADVLEGIAIALPAYTLAYVLSGFFKGVKKPATASLMENGAIALFAAVIVLSMEYWSEPTLSVLGSAYAISGWFVLFLGAGRAWLWLKKTELKRDDFCSVSASSRHLGSTSSAFFFISLAGFLQSVVGVFIAAYLLSDSQLGVFKSSQQVSVLIGFVLIVINAIFPPRFAELYHVGNLKGLERLSRQGAALGVFIASPLLLLCLLFPAWFLGLFGEGFSDGANLLRIICVAQIINVATGSVAFLLNMTGYEKLVRNIALISNGLGVLGFWFFTLAWGAMGTAAAVAFVLIVQNLVSLFFVWKKLGIWTMPMPNLFKIFGVKTENDKVGR